MNVSPYMCLSESSRTEDLLQTIKGEYDCLSVDLDLTSVSSLASSLVTYFLVLVLNKIH